MRRVVAVTLLLWGLASGVAMGEVTAGQIAPDFGLPRWSDSANVSLKNDMAGKIVLVDFFATWCGPCNTAASEIEPLIQDYYAGRGGNAAGLPVQVLSVCINYNETVAVNSFIAQHGLDPKVVLKDTSYAFGTYGKGYVPHFALISGLADARYQGAAVPQWQVLWTQTGYAAGSYQTIRAKIDAITVPEPATIGLLLAGAVLVIRRRQRRA